MSLLEDPHLSVSLIQNPTAIFREKTTQDLAVIKRREGGLLYAYIPFLGVVIDCRSQNAIKFAGSFFRTRSLKMQLYWRLLLIQPLQRFLVPFFIEIHTQNRIEKKPDVCLLRTGVRSKLFFLGGKEVCNVYKEGVSRDYMEREIESRNRASKHIPVPQVLHINREKGYFFEELLEGRALSLAEVKNDSTPLHVVGKRLTSFYEDTRVPNKHSHEYAKNLHEKYENTLQQSSFSPEIEQRILALFKKGEKHVNSFSSFEIAFSIIHGDLHRESVFLSSTNDPFVIDWEYSQEGTMLHDAFNFFAQIFINDEDDTFLVDMFRNDHSNLPFFKESGRIVGHVSSSEFKVLFYVYVLEMMLFRIQDWRYQKNEADLAWLLGRIERLYNYAQYES